MKTMKRVAGILLAVTMLLALGLHAAAAEATYSITINQTEEGHVYQAYQIFQGKLDAAANPDSVPGTSGVLSDITWGPGVANTAAVEAAFGGDNAAAIAKRMSSGYVPKDGEKPAITLEQLIAEIQLSATCTESVKGEGVYTISNLAAGYYLVKDKDGTLNGNQAYTKYIIEVVENSVVDPKTAIPTVEKKVQDINDSKETLPTDWQDSADYDLGDHVPFLLKATLSNDVTAYKSAYQLVFHDTLSAGLTFDASSLKVYLNDSEEPLSSTLYSVSHLTGVLEVTIPDVKAAGATNGDVIRVEYTATLNEHAVLGQAGNPNTVYLEFSNNPNSATGTETGKTPADKVMVFTYKLSAHKVNDALEPLQGAGFTLYKKNAATGEYAVVGAEVKGEAMTTFEWTGLDDGDYRLVETTTPLGYNTIAPIDFVISAAHDATSADPKLTSLTGGDLVTGNAATGLLETQIINRRGSVLPETGGIGTTIFYVAGGLLVLGAIVFLVIRTRKANR